MNTSAAHLELHTCISLSSNCQEFVTNSSRLTYCSPLPLDAMNFFKYYHTEESLSAVHLVNTAPSTAVLHAFGKDFKQHNTAHSTQPSFHSHIVEGIAAETGRFQNQNFGPPLVSGATIELVCPSLQCGPQMSALRCGFVYNCVESARYTAVSVSVFTKYRNSFLYGNLFLKLLTSSGSGAK